VSILKKQKVICKILVNPKSLCRKEDKSATNEKILSLYDWVGLSINTEEEIGLLEQLVPTSGPSWFNVQKSTIISNFNLQNIFLYDIIEAFVKAHSLTWQVQYTVFKEKDKSLALYENQSALDFFFKKIQESIKNNIKVVLADNMNNGKCGAGLNSLGILYDGDIVPCLSMRSWVEDINSVVVGNIIKEDGWSEIENVEYDTYIKNPLKYIWENRFNKYRFECFIFRISNRKCRKFRRTFIWKSFEKNMEYYE
jgi:radical SAM protein with 4Fe4S-binding SPASM domain